MKVAADGTRKVPIREVLRVTGDIAELDCGHPIDLDPVARREVRERYPCMTCARDPPPEQPTRTPAQKKLIKRHKLGPDEWVSLVRIARGEWPFAPLPGANAPAMIVVLLRQKGYAVYEDEQTEARGAASSYVVSPRGAAAVVFATHDEWNTSPELAQSLGIDTPQGPTT